MTVGSKVKSCFAAVKSAEAAIMTLVEKSQDENTKQSFNEAQSILTDVKSDLQQQVLFLTREEPQYKQ